MTLSGVGIDDDEDAINIYGGDGGSALSLTALGGAGGEGGEIAVNASDSEFDSLTITLEDADSDVDVSLNNSDYVVLSADGADVTLDDVRTTGSGIDGVGDTATAASVGLSATGDIGSAVAALSVSADLLTAVAGGDIFLNEADDVEITELAAYGDITVAAATLTLSEVTVFAEGSVTFDAEVNIAGDVIVATDEFDGDISFNGGGSSASDEATLTLVAGAGDILFDGGDFLPARKIRSAS